eukprot:12414275-Karenia_brevis.AAC.1
MEIGDKVTKFIPEVQCGATAGKGTDMATHTLRLLQDYAKLHNKSLAILFVDLTKAFDRVLREVVFGWFSDPNLPPEDRRRQGISDLIGKGLTKQQAAKMANMIEHGT